MNWVKHNTRKRAVKRKGERRKMCHSTKSQSKDIHRD